MPAHRGALSARECGCGHDLIPRWAGSAVRSPRHRPRASRRGGSLARDGGLLAPLGLAIVLLAFLCASCRIEGSPLADLQVALGILFGLAGLLVLVPAAIGLLVSRQFVHVALVLIGTPLVTLRIAGLVVSLLAGRLPIDILWTFGAAGVTLLIMAHRECRRHGRRVGV